MADRYSFRLNSFQIQNTMALHTDTDYVYFTVKVGGTTFGPRHQKIGDLNNGIYPLNWSVGPVPVDAGTPVLMTYQIINHGHDDATKQATDDIAIANKIAAAAGGIVGAVFPPAAGIVAIITGALGTLGSIIGWLFGAINCDGVVLSDAVSVNGATLAGWTHPTGTHTETRNYRGPETPVGCGSDARYSVTWSVIWPDKPKESKEHKDKEKEKEKEHGKLEAKEKDIEHTMASEPMAPAAPEAAALPQPGAQPPAAPESAAAEGPIPYPETPFDTAFF